MSDKEGNDKEMETEEVEDLQNSSKNRKRKKEVKTPEPRKRSKTVKDNSTNDEDDETSEDDEAGPIPLLDQSPSVTGRRIRKQVERLNVSSPAGSESPVRRKSELLQGKGDKLGTSPKILSQLQNVKHSDMTLLHRLLFKRPGTAYEIKRNIREFSGFPFEKEDKEFESRKHTLEKNTLTDLKFICQILCLEKGGTKEAIIERILEFLLCPHPDNKPVKSKKSKKSKSNKSSAKEETKAARKSPKKNVKSNQVVDESSSSEDDSDEESDQESEVEPPKKKARQAPAKDKNKTPKKTPKREMKIKLPLVTSSKKKSAVSKTSESESDEKKQTKKKLAVSDDSGSESESKKPVTRKKRNVKSKALPVSDESEKSEPEAEKSESDTEMKNNESVDKTDVEEEEENVSSTEEKADKDEGKESSKEKLVAQGKDGDESEKKGNNQTDKSEKEEVARLTANPTDDELEETIKTILKDADLQDLTMKNLCLKVYAMYPNCNLEKEKKDFIRSTAKGILGKN